MKLFDALFLFLFVPIVPFCSLPQLQRFSTIRAHHIDHIILFYHILAIIHLHLFTFINPTFHLPSLTTVRNSGSEPFCRPRRHKEGLPQARCKVPPRQEQGGRRNPEVPKNIRSFRDPLRRL